MRTKQAQAQLSSFDTDDVRDELESSADARGPGDSHYEWPLVSDLEQDDSQVELPAFTASDEPSSDDLPAYPPDDPSDEIFVTEAEPPALTNRWARYRAIYANLIRLVSLAILGFFVLQWVLNAPNLGAAILAFVAGCFGLGGLLVLSTFQGTQPKLLSAFTTGVRRSRPSELDGPIPSD